MKFIIKNKWYFIVAALLLIVIIYLVLHNKAQDKKEHSKKKAPIKVPKKQSADSQGAPIDDGTNNIPATMQNPNRTQLDNIIDEINKEKDAAQNAGSQNAIDALKKII